MSRRYQVFVSSTYRDLLEERAEVMQALLELDCMPAGMELFPAANEEQWGWIRKVIDESDYYIVILAGRYGSVSKDTGTSFTEMEYNYALSVGKPIIAFLHSDPSEIPSGRSEPSPQGKKRLASFRRNLESRLCKYWSNPADLGGKVSRSITQLIKHEPAVGWVRANEIPEDQTLLVAKLRERIHELEKAAQENHVRGSELAQGADELRLTFYYEWQQPRIGKTGQRYWVKGGSDDDEIVTSWDAVFSTIAPELMSSRPDHRISMVLNAAIRETFLPAFPDLHPGCRLTVLKIYEDTLEKLRIQFMALGLIEVGKLEEWVLTEAGRKHMVRLVAVHREGGGDTA